MKKGRPDKRGQAAMEYLMTYGWSILIVLIAVAALFYFGVLDPEQFKTKPECDCITYEESIELNYTKAFCKGDIYITCEDVSDVDKGIV